LNITSPLHKDIQLLIFGVPRNEVDMSDELVRKIRALKSWRPDEWFLYEIRGVLLQ